MLLWCRRGAAEVSISGMIASVHAGRVEDYSTAFLAGVGAVKPADRRAGLRSDEHAPRTEPMAAPTSQR